MCLGGVSTAFFHSVFRKKPFSGNVLALRPILIVRKTENENQPKGLPCIRHRWFSKKVKFVTLSPRKRKPTHDCLLTRVTRLGIRRNTPARVGISTTLQVLSLVFSHSKVKYVLLSSLFLALRLRLLPHLPQRSLRPLLSRSTPSRRVPLPLSDSSSILLALLPRPMNLS